MANPPRRMPQAAKGHPRLIAQGPLAGTADANFVRPELPKASPAPIAFGAGLTRARRRRGPARGWTPTCVRRQLAVKSKREMVPWKEARAKLRFRRSPSFPTRDNPEAQAHPSRPASLPRSRAQERQARSRCRRWRASGYLLRLCRRFRRNRSLRRVSKSPSGVATPTTAVWPPFDGAEMVASSIVTPDGMNGAVPLVEVQSARMNSPLPAGIWSPGRPGDGHRGGDKFGLGKGEFEEFFERPAASWNFSCQAAIRCC